MHSATFPDSITTVSPSKVTQLQGSSISTIHGKSNRRNNVYLCVAHKYARRKTLLQPSISKRYAQVHLFPRENYR